MYFYRFIFIIALAAITNATTAQYWQQKADYKIDFNLNSENHQFKGKETIIYTNNSPDDLTQLYFHLYFNAFQPGSAMDTRSLWISDPDGRVGDRISKLQPNEFGQLHVTSLLVNGKAQSLLESETILEVTLSTPIAKGAKATIELEFEGQVPIQIRRSGRSNAEGIDYSMTQWYPKMCEFDRNGWHPNPYIGREFYGIWGNFEVNLTLPKKYIIGATGILTNAAEIGYGYIEENKVKRANTETLTWKFKAENVHDFAWGADPDYVHKTAQIENGPLLHFFYQEDPAYMNSWKDGQELVVKGFKYLSDHFGKYPYPQYSIIQGGDGGMEYPMATLITGNRKVPSYVGVVLHEAAHSWYQGILATNEALYPWMDEGFTSYASSEAFNTLFAGRIPGDHSGAYDGYIAIVNEGKEEALDTHADHYITNYAYGTASYNKGEVYLAQLGYVVGKENLEKGLLKYFDMWKFKHPTADDFIHVIELQSGMVLDWYNEYFVNTTKTIDYAITGASSAKGKTNVMIERKGMMPMPVEVEVTLSNGKKEMYYIALDLMRGEKQKGNYNYDWKILQDWKWVNTSYVLELPYSASDIQSVVIDPSEGMADIDRSNNELKLGDGIEFILKKD